MRVATSVEQGPDGVRCDAGPIFATAAAATPHDPASDATATFVGVAQARRRVGVTMRYAPEFIIGPRQSSTYVTFFWSPSCTDTRDLYASVMKAFMVQTARDRKATVIVHLHPRNAADADISKVLLSVQPRFYARYVLTVLERFVRDRRAPSLADVSAIAAEKRLAADPRFNASTAADVIYADHDVNQNYVGVRDTPSLFANAERAIHPRRVEELVDFLRRRAAYTG